MRKSFLIEYAKAWFVFCSRASSDFWTFQIVLATFGSMEKNKAHRGCQLERLAYVIAARPLLYMCR